MTKIVTAHSTSLDGCIAGADDRPEQPLGVGGDRLFTWFSDGDTPSRYYPGFKMSAVSAAFFDEGAAGSARSSRGGGPTTSPRPGAGAARCLASRCSS
jgi:hypothetical protein